MIAYVEKYIQLKLIMMRYLRIKIYYRLTNGVGYYPKTVIGRGQGTSALRRCFLFGFKAVNQCSKWI